MAFDKENPSSHAEQIDSEIRKPHHHPESTLKSCSMPLFYAQIRDYSMYRRDFILGLSSSALISLVGCGGAYVGSSKSPVPAVAVTELIFNDSQEFYSELDKSLENGQNVVVVVREPLRINASSRMVTHFMRGASNREELFREVTSMDTPDGRKQLTKLFDDELVSHKSVAERMTLPSGEVIEPATVVLVLGVLLIVSLASVAHAESARGRSYTVGFELSKSRIQFFAQGK